MQRIRYTTLIISQHNKSSGKTKPSSFLELVLPTGSDRHIRPKVLCGHVVHILQNGYLGKIFATIFEFVPGEDFVILNDHARFKVQVTDGGDRANILRRLFIGATQRNQEIFRESCLAENPRVQEIHFSTWQILARSEHEHLPLVTHKIPKPRPGSGLQDQIGKILFSVSIVVDNQ